ncbi:gluconeogenesis factor YvcK family protein [Senegalia massiliensis]|uniref:Putative gluconeogenesis factor n=1 Tax=Senegalia massiliensis TaxID=1720316 RepID=A0A845R3C4_9CLOT|nr:YvcK family protein [Senegalia massiliensis]NBI08186.1 YvcK family protein [Senegalia massiliensis]
MKKIYSIKSGIKRWVILCIIGVILLSLGISPIYKYMDLIIINNYMYIIMVIFGVAITFFALRRVLTIILTIVNQHKYEVDISRNSVTGMLNKKKILDKGPRVVILGGGTGLSVLLRGLKNHTSNITAVVTVADDGGGSGVLRSDLGMLPPGDIRSCILALADTEPTMEKLIQYRFTEGDLKGQSFGNLFIAAMNGIYDNFELAIKEMSNVLAVSGKVLPMTLEDVTLFAKLKNGKTVKGESNIPLINGKVNSEIDYVFLKPEESFPLEETIEEIKRADIILLGPGSLYTSVIPNLMIKGIVEELEKSSADKVYIANVMTQPGETDNYSVKDHISAILKHSSEDIIDHVIVNNEKLPLEIFEKYSFDGSEPVLLTKEDEKFLKANNINIIEDNLIDIKNEYIRHDTVELSRIIVELVPKYKSKILNFLISKRDISKN